MISQLTRFIFKLQWTNKQKLLSIIHNAIHKAKLSKVSYTVKVVHGLQLIS